MKAKRLVAVAAAAVLLAGGGLAGLYYLTLAGLRGGPSYEKPDGLLKEYNGPRPGETLTTEPFDPK